jgi:hypothetical protein
MTDLPRTLADLRSILHGYRIKAGKETPQSIMASTIIEGIDNLLSGVPADQAYHITLNMQRAARELAEIDPSLAWLPDWKPRVAVKGGANGSD